jgi:hypothetical protein
VSDVGQKLFWAKVLKGLPDECWPWQGYKKPSGHGLTSYQSMPIHASRKAWILTHGPIRDDLCVNHTCDHADCCNPSHMYLGSRADNMIDYWHKTPAAERATRGRPTVLDEAQLARLWEVRKNGATLEACAEMFGVHRATIARYITAERRKKVEKLQRLRVTNLSVAAKTVV